MSNPTVKLDGVTLIVTNAQSKLAVIRAIPGRRWERDTLAWYVPYVKETYDQLKNGGFQVSHIPRPDWSGYLIDRPEGKTFLTVKTLNTPDDVQRCKRIPEYRSYSSNLGAWICKPTAKNVEYLRRAFPHAQWTTPASAFTAAYTTADSAPLLPPVPLKLVQDISDFVFPTSPDPATGKLRKPRGHQIDAFRFSRGKQGFGHFLEQRLGKCYIQICEVMDLVDNQKVNSWLIVCPNSVKDVWLEEIETWLPKEYTADVFLWDASTRYKVDQFIHQNVTGDKRFKVLVMNFDAFSTERGQKAGMQFVTKHASLITLDECTRIKSPGAARTKALIKVGWKAPYRRILSGTPITQGPLDIFAPFKFLGPTLLGFSSFFSFRNRYAVMGGWEGKQILGYTNLEELQTRVDAHSYRKLLAEVSDMPDPVFEKRYTKLEGEQLRLYEQLRDEFILEAMGKKENIIHTITKILRLQQIVGGFLPSKRLDEDDRNSVVNGIPIEGENGKLTLLLESLEEDRTPEQKAIIWARFRPEIDLIQRTLREKYGHASVVEFHGGVTGPQRKENRRLFQDMNSPVKFFIGQPMTGGLGIALYAGDLTIFFSNEHSLEARLQAQSRALLPEKTTPHLFIDLVARNTLDVKTIAGLRGKKGLSDLITGDPSLSWI